MNDRELFKEILNNFIENYKLEIKYPYGDDYFEIYKNGNQIGGFNPSGFSLLYNLKRLCNLLEAELL